MAKVCSPNNRRVMAVKIAQFLIFKVQFSPVGKKGVESVIGSRIVALMTFMAPQI